MRKRSPFASAFVLSLLVVAGPACGGGNSTPIDSASAVDAFQSTCGHPGDTGNELGIGHFCEKLSDCNSTASAPLCSIIGDSTTHFCTKTCTATGSGSNCGTGASCTCNSGGQCGCTPDVCLTGSGSGSAL